MKIRNVDFKPVLNASGARGFYGEGWWFHNFFKPFGLSFNKSTLVTKTVTLHPNKGNLKSTVIPNCIRMQFFKKTILNAVGLTNKGIIYYIKYWDNIEDPFIISISAIDKTFEERTESINNIVTILNEFKHNCNRPFGVQLNISCPNVKHKIDDFKNEFITLTNISNKLNVPLITKINILSDPKFIAEIINESFSDAVIISNTIPWGITIPWLSKDDEYQINWDMYYKNNPLAKFGGGGLSGKPLLDINLMYIKKLKEFGLKKGIIGEGGIFSFEDAKRYFDAGVNGIGLGSVCILRPWKVKSIISKVNQLFQHKELI